MSNDSAFRKAWELLDARERRNALIVLAVMIVSAFAAAAMVISIFPFLSVLSDPELVRKSRAFRILNKIGGFDSGYDFVVALGLASIVVIVVANLLLILNTWAVTRFSQMRIHSISHRLLTHYLSQPYEFFLGRHSGDMSTNVLSEASLVVNEFIRPAMVLFSSSLTIILTITVLLLVNPLVAVMTFGVFGSIYALALLAARKFAKRIGRERSAANERRFRIAGEAFAGVKDVKLLGREAAYLQLYGPPSHSFARTQTHLTILGQTPRFVIQIVAFGGIILIALALLEPAKFGERDALAELLPLLGLLAFAGQRLLPELQNFYQALTTLNAGSAALERVHRDLASFDERKLDQSDPPPLGLHRSLKLVDVSYTYSGAQRRSLNSITFELKAGERIGVVGSSGAGKTTLVDAILGLLTPDSGQIKVDGSLLSTDNLRAWRKSVGYVPQEIFLTDASLAENIALGLGPEEIDMDKIKHAAQISCLHEFVSTELQQGYNALIGERGVRLSGGQRQRIGIARALYHDPDLILFDEATSALDNLTEAEVMKAIEMLPGGKTVVIIAHRLSTVRHCDRIIMLDRGEILGIGSWEKLNEHNAKFRSLAQAG